MKTKEYFDEKLTEMAVKWLSYKEELDGGKDITNNTLSLLDELRDTKKDYLNTFGYPNLIQKACIAMEGPMYKIAALRPIRMAVLERDEKLSFLVSFNVLEDLVARLYEKEETNKKKPVTSKELDAYLMYTIDDTKKSKEKLNKEKADKKLEKLMQKLHSLAKEYDMDYSDKPYADEVKEHIRKTLEEEIRDQYIIIDD